MSREISSDDLRRELFAKLEIIRLYLEQNLEQNGRGENRI